MRNGALIAIVALLAIGLGWRWISAPQVTPENAAPSVAASAQPPLEVAATETEPAPRAEKSTRPRDITFDDVKLELKKGDPYDSSLLTDKVKGFDGKSVRVRGYMLPAFQQNGIKQFVLVRDNQECCFGPGALLHDCIFVEMLPPATTSYSFRPVSVEGKFSIHELKGPDGQYLAIYHLDGKEVKHAGQESSIPDYVEALCREINNVARSAPERITAHTIFFGGGTPSLLSPAQFDSILKVTRDSFELTSDVEISLEANPGTVSLYYLRDLYSLGFNRISLGVQSIHPEELRQLERIHDTFDVIKAVNWARQAGFGNLNLDLIFGLPEQPLERWQDTVRFILDLRPEHLSLYALTVEHGTPFGRWTSQGLLPIPDPDVAADMYEWAGATLEAAGFEQYEISNWSKPGRECQHNLQYWRGQPYLGFGAGAHGYANGKRIANVLRIRTYIERIQESLPISNTLFPLSPATVKQSGITKYVEMQETMMTGLRLTHEGVSEETFVDRFGVEMWDVFKREIDELIRLGLLEWVDLHHPPAFPDKKGRRSLRLTKRGRFLGNQVFMRFVD